MTTRYELRTVYNTICDLSRTDRENPVTLQDVIDDVEDGVSEEAVLNSVHNLKKISVISVSMVSEVQPIELPSSAVDDRIQRFGNLTVGQQQGVNMALEAEGKEPGLLESDGGLRYLLSVAAK
jgi:hypothetical protein